MIIKLLTPRKTITVGTEMNLYSWGALTVTVESPSLIHPEQQNYHVTFTKEDLTFLLSKIEERESEIKTDMENWRKNRE